jgi:hypothetical protein
MEIVPVLKYYEILAAWRITLTRATSGHHMQGLVDGTVNLFGPMKKIEHAKCAGTWI